MCFRIRIFGTSFSPESISLTSARRTRAYRSRNMKEKLLREGVVEHIEEGEERSAGAGVLNHPAAYSMSSLPPTPSLYAGDRDVKPVPVSSRPDSKYEVE